MGKQQVLIRKIENKGSFVRAFKEVFASLKSVKEYRLYGYFIIPFLLNIIILSFMIYFSYNNILPLSTHAITGEGIFFDILRRLLAPLILIALSIVTIFIYSIIGTIITAPFNDILSEKLEEKLTGEKFNEKFSFSAFFEDIFRVLKNILKLLIAILIINILLLLLNFLPLIGTVMYTILSFIVTLFFLGFQFYDYPLERRKQTFGQKIKTLMYFKMQVLGLGLGFMVLSLIPIVGFLGLNMATIGATVMFVEYIKPALIPESETTNIAKTE